MKFSAQSSYLYNCERAPSCAEYIVCSRVCTLTPFFLNLYSRLSLVFAMIASVLYVTFTPVRLGPLLPNGIIALTSKIASLADGAKPTDEYL